MSLLTQYLKLMYHAAGSTVGVQTVKDQDIYIEQVYPIHSIQQKKMNKKLLHRRASTPKTIVSDFLDKPTQVRRRNTLPSRLELIPESIQQQEFVICKNKKNLRPNTASPNETIKLPWIDTNREDIKCYHLGSISKLDASHRIVRIVDASHRISKLDESSTEKGTVERFQRSSYRNDFCSGKNPFVTSQRHCNMVSKETSLSRQFLCGSDHRGHSEALRQFLTNAEQTFDSSKEKAMIIYNWMSTQTLLSRS